MTPLHSVPLRSRGQVGRTWMLAQHLWSWITFLNRNPSFPASHPLIIRMTSNGWYCYCTFSASILFVTELWLLDIFHLEKWKDKDFLKALEIFKHIQERNLIKKKAKHSTSSQFNEYTLQIDSDGAYLKEYINSPKKKCAV